MNQQELTKAFMMISNWKKPFGLQGFHQKIQRSKGNLLIKQIKDDYDSLYVTVEG